MIKEALQHLIELGQKAAEVERLALPGGQVLIKMPGGEYMERADDPTPVFDKLETVDDLASWLRDNGDMGNLPTVFVGESIIEAALYRTEARRAVVELKHSAAFKCLEMWCKAEAGFAQARVVRLLRGELAGCYNPAILAVFRRLDFTRRKQAGGELSHNKESLGRSVEAMAQSSSGEIPETILFDVPLYTLPEAGKVPISVAVQVNSETETIAIYPEGDTIERAERETRERLRSVIASRVEEYVSVYKGKCR